MRQDSWKSRCTDNQELFKCIFCREEAIKLLQIHERARQGRLRAKLMRDIRNSEKQSEQKKTKETAEPEDSQVSLAVAAVR